MAPHQTPRGERTTPDPISRARPRPAHAALSVLVLLALGCSPQDTDPPLEPAEEPAEDAAEEPGAEDETEEEAEDDRAEETRGEASETRDRAPGGDDADDAEDAEGTEDAEDTDLTDPVVVEQTVWNFDTMEEVDLRVVVHPFVRVAAGDGDFLNGLITYEVLTEDGEYHLEGHGNFPEEMRLIDAEAMTVSYPSLGTDGDDHWIIADVESPTIRHGDDPARWAGVYADPGTEEVALLVPYLGLIEGIGIVESDDVDTSDYVPVQEALPELVEIHTMTWDLQTHRETTGGDVQIRESEQDATITLDSDILFDIDEHVLTSEADDALQAAAEELERAEGGELEIIGHTDDVRSLEHNQQLSEDRADAVYERLGELTDLDGFTVSTEGRAFHEPVATNDTEEGRAMNRRVELHYTPAEDEADEDEPAEPDTGDLPETSGPVGALGEAIEVSSPELGTVEVTVEEVYPVGELLVGRVRVEVVEEPEDGAPSTLAWALSFGDLGLNEMHDNRYNPGHQADALTLLDGDQRYFPLEFGDREIFVDADDDGFIMEEGDPWRVVTADRGFGYEADAELGTWSVATVLWPNTGQEELVVDVPGQTEHASRPWSEPWRAVDIPVEPAQE